MLAHARERTGDCSDASIRRLDWGCPHARERDTIVLERSTLRRGDIVSEILSHPDIANAPPAQRQNETPYAAPHRTRQTNVGATHDAGCAR